MPRGEAARTAVADGVAMITQHGQPTPATVPAGSGPNNGGKIHGCFLRVNVQAMRWRCDVRLDAFTGRRVPGAPAARSFLKRASTASGLWWRCRTPSFDMCS